MTINVQLTEPDYREANAAVRAAKLMSINTMPAFYVLISSTIGTMVGNLLQPQFSGGPPRSVFEVIVSSFPLLMTSAYWGIIILRTRAKKAHGFVRPPPSLTGLGVTFSAVLCIVLFVIAVVATMYIPVIPEPPINPKTPQQPTGKLLAMLFLPWVPIVAMLIGTVWIFLRLMFRNVTRAYELQGNLHEPRTFLIEDDAVTVADSTHQTRYAWTAFIGWHETDHVILLYISYISFEMIPKRSFESFQAFQGFLDVVRLKVGERRGGFDLLPVQGAVQAGDGIAVQPPPRPPGFDGR